MFYSLPIVLLVKIDEMAASENLAVLQSSVLVAPVTALEFLGDEWLLTGELHAGADRV